jgi:hypothetical protein
MDKDELLKENEMLRTLLGLAGLPEKDRAKRLLMHDLYTLNAMILNFINKSSALGVDLADLKIADKSTADLFLSTKNVPLIPLFKIETGFVASTLELCQEDELFSNVTLTHMRIYW